MSWIIDRAEWVRKLRDDLSNYVIHFTKNAGSLSGKDVLLKILNDGEIKPSFAEVKGSAPSREQIRVGMRGGFADTDPAQGGV